MVATIIILITFIILVLIYIATVVILLRKLKKIIAVDASQKNEIRNESLVQFRLNSRDKRVGMPESMCSNDAYMKNPIETELPYQEIKVLDYSHVYASPFRKSEDRQIDSVGSCDHYVQNPAYQIGSYLSNSESMRYV